MKARFIPEPDKLPPGKAHPISDFLAVAQQGFPLALERQRERLLLPLTVPLQMMKRNSKSRSRTGKDSGYQAWTVLMIKNAFARLSGIRRSSEVTVTTQTPADLIAMAFKRCAAALALAVTLVSLAPAQSQPPELRVAVAVVPPFVMQQNEALSGFSIELWNAVAARLKTKANYLVMPDATSLIEVMRSKKADIVASPVVITSARDEEFDFSLPVMQSGLQVMVRETGHTATANPLEDLLRLLFSRTTVIWLGIALVMVLIPAHLVWVLERRYKDGIISSPKYFPGIFEAAYWAVSTLTTQAEFMPRQWIARVFAILWMFTGVVFVAFYTAQLTTTLTVRQIQGSINGPEDLPGKQVGTIANSTAADYLRTQNVHAQEFAGTDNMFQALLNRKVDAVVFGSPVLLFYAAHDGKGKVRTVGPEFNTTPIALGFQLGSPLRRRVNRALLELRENGSYQQLYNKWFGGP